MCWTRSTQREPARLRCREDDARGRAVLVLREEGEAAACGGMQFFAERTASEPYGS